MLTGRESLRRLIGKRRRHLPNTHRLLSSTTTTTAAASSTASSHSSLNVEIDRNDAKINEETKTTELIEENPSFKKDDFVICPVCGNNIRGDDSSVNSHLDLCLVRGTKRKLSQRTLLQFSFSSVVKSKTCTEKVSVGTDDYHIASGSEAIPKDLQLACDDEQKKLASSFLITPCKSSVHLESSASLSAEVSVEKDLNKSDTYESFCAPPSCHNVEIPVDKHFIEINTNEVADDPPSFLNLDLAGVLYKLSALGLETHIVGRKFGDVAEVIYGADVSLLRDPDNVKDPNAIKVVSPEPGSSGVLGYLPRGVALHLSPLIDKYQLNFEGVITSVPKNSIDAVPIEITCPPTAINNDLANEDLHTLKCLCKNIFQYVKSGIKSPPSTAKYQQNFCCMVEDVLKNNSHLFTDHEKIFLESFSSISDNGQRLFVRLYTRKGPWLRISNLSYPEIVDYKFAADELSEASFFRSFGCKSEVDDTDMKEILEILTVSELLEIVRTHKKGLQGSRAGMRKKDLTAALYSSYRDGLCPLLPDLILDKTGMCVRISSIAESLLWRVQRLFFLDGEQDLSSFLLVDLGIVKYPEYKCTICDPIFPSRIDFLAFEEAIEIAQLMDQSLDEENSELVLQCIEIAESQLSRMKNHLLQLEARSAFLKCFSACWVYSRVALLGVSYYEQERRYQDAVKLLKLLLNNFKLDRRRGYWTLRLSVDLEHLGFIEESLCIAEDGVLDPWVRAGPKMALQRRVIRLGKPPRRWKVPHYADFVKRKIAEVRIQGRPLSSEVGMKSRFYGDDGEQCGVEDLALQFYAGEGGGWQGVHTESGIWLTIYGVLMWDIIFMDVPNVFRTRFQNAPLDMDCDSFYVDRTTIIESHLQKIYEGQGEAILIMSWELHFGTVCRGVNWERHTLAELRAAVTCIGGPCLANLCRLLAQDFRSWSSGMPDLLLWRFHGDFHGEAKLVEVKGPRDRLSEQQRAWLLTLMDCGFAAEVCKVTPPAMKSSG